MGREEELLAPKKRPLRADAAGTRERPPRLPALGSPVRTFLPVSFSARRLPSVLVLVVLALLAGGLRPGAGAGLRVAEARGAATTQAGLATRLARRLKKAGLRSADHGVVVMTRGAQPRVVFAHNATRPLRPASAAKVLTSAAALDLLGPSHVFRTRLTARGAIADGTLEGDLVLHGSADPNLSGREFSGDAMHVPDAFASAVRRAGIRRVTGALVLDEGVLDKEYVHADWSAADKRLWYGAPVGGLSFNDGCIDIQLAVPKRGGSPSLHLPATAGGWPVRNDVLTKKGARNGAAGRWIEDGRVLRLTGRLRPGGRTSFHVPVLDPARFLGGALLHALEKNGVRVAGGQRHARDGHDRLPGRLVSEHTSELPATLLVLNRRSQNFYAGMLFKLCGAALEGRGSWASGGRAVRAMLERRHIEDQGTTEMRDGSGLSPKNLVSAGALTSVLWAFDEDVLRGPLLLDSLPTSGVSGTLRRRLRERGVKGRVHAKTGTLNEHPARALAGYVDGRKGAPGYVFAILLNGRGASHALIDDLVREIAR